MEELKLQAKACPLCNEPGPSQLNTNTLHTVLSHLAKHLEEISAQALPRTIASEATSVSTTEGLISHGSRSEDALVAELNKHVLQTGTHMFSCGVTGCSKRYAYASWNGCRIHIEKEHVKFYNKLKEDVSVSLGLAAGSGGYFLSPTCLYVGNLPRNGKSVILSLTFILRA